MRRGSSTALSLIVFLAFPVLAAPNCASTVRELRALLQDPDFPLRWQETTMDDGKPLVLSLLERDGALVLSFTKARDGLWAEGAASICTKPPGLEAHFPGRMMVGPAAHWAMRYALGRGAPFSLTRQEGGHLGIATAGWKGQFVARPGE